MYLKEVGWGYSDCTHLSEDVNQWQAVVFQVMYEGWNFNSGNYLFTTDTK